LSLQIVDFNEVAIDQPELANTCAGELIGDGATERTAPNDNHTGRANRVLTAWANRSENGLANVASALIEFRRHEEHLREICALPLGTERDSTAMVQSSSMLDDDADHRRRVRPNLLFHPNLNPITMIRITIIDIRRTTTFMAPPHALKAVTAACARGAGSATEILSELSLFDPDLARELRDQLDVFLEHNVADNTRWIADRIAASANYPEPVVVLDDATRSLSLMPGDLGLVLFNIPSKRIVQIENHYANLERSDRGRIRRNGQPTRALYRYALPDEWQIVP
jgi:hypothetical protein